MQCLQSTRNIPMIATPSGYLPLRSKPLIRKVRAIQYYNINIRIHNLRSPDTIMKYM